MSSPMATAPHARWARPQWLARGGIDLPLLLVTPLLLIPFFDWLSTRLSDEMIVLGVTLFGANAHHLPGFMRAYGDPAFRSRYALRLTLAPIAIVTICLAFFHLELNGLLFVTFVWGIWHALAQVYGIGRMYDGRARLISATTARLDKAVCLGWFFGGFLFSDHRSSLALGELYRCGVPAIPAEGLSLLRWGWLAGTLVLTVAWGVNQARLAREGRGNFLKVVLFASSFGFWWYANLPIESAIVGVVLFEAFHDVQYLTTVWLYNRKVVEKGGRLGAFSRILFRPGVIGILIYVGLCMAYGSSSMAGKLLLGDGAVKTLGALVLSSLLLHFYYDSFLWNVRDAAVRDDFDLATTDDAKSAAPLGAGAGFRIPEGAAWAWFAVPLLSLLVVQTVVDADEVTWRAHLVDSLPAHAPSVESLARARLETGDWDAALGSYERAVELAPERVSALRGLVESSVRTGHLSQARDALARLDAQGGADVATLLGVGAAMNTISPEESRTLFERAVELAPGDVDARLNLATVDFELGRLERARRQLRTARQLAPADSRVLYALGLVEADRGDVDAAREAFGALLQRQPGHSAARRELRRLDPERDRSR